MIAYVKGDKLRAPDLADVKIGGSIGETADLFFEKRIMSEHAKNEVFKEAEDAFRRCADDETIVGYWQGEFWGKLVVSAARVCRYNHSDELRAFLRQAANTMLSFQREDGYIGTYKNADNVLTPPVSETKKLVGWECNWNWNIWCRKYTLWGLIECYELLGDEDILTACRRLADHLIDQLARLHLTLGETGTFNGLPSGSIIKPMLSLYRLTGEARYLELCVRTAEDWDRPDGKMPNLIANARAGLPLHEWYPTSNKWAKAYEMMSCLDGLMALYRATGTEKYLFTVKRMYELLSENELNALFSVGYNDVFAHASAELNAITEPCDVIHWMRLCYELFTVTGETKYMDTFERAYLNPFMAGVFAADGWGSRGVRSSGRHMISHQVGFTHNHCCVNNIPRGFMNAAQAAVAADGQNIYVSLFTDFDAKLNLPGGEVNVRIRGSYLKDCRATITVDNASGAAQRLFLRVPGWSRLSRVVAGGQAFAPEAGGWFETPLAQGEAQFAIEYDAAPVIHSFEGPTREPSDWRVVRWCNRVTDSFGTMGAVSEDKMAVGGRCTVTAGPLLLARSKRVGCTEDEMFSAPSLYAKSAACRLTPLEKPGVWCAFEAELSAPGALTKTTLCDFASAANEMTLDEGYFSIWL